MSRSRRVSVLLILLALIGLGTTVLPASPNDPDRPTPPGFPPPLVRAFELRMAPHVMAYLDAFGLLVLGQVVFGWPDYVPREDAASIEATVPGYGETLKGLRTDLYMLNTGAPVEYRQEYRGVDVWGTVVYPKGDEVEVEYDLAGPPAAGTEFRLSFGLSLQQRFNRCGLCTAIRQWFFGAPAHAQTPNHYTGPGFREDVAIVARLEAPGRTSLRAIVRGEARTIPGTVEVEGSKVEITLKWTTLGELGLARTGLRVFMGVIGPAGVFDRVPNVGAVQLGFDQAGTSTPRIIARFDVNADGKADLYYLDTNNNGTIDAAGRDYDGDGRLELMKGEGPFLYRAQDGQLYAFERVESRVTGKRHVFWVSNSQITHVTIVEDKNGDGDVTDPGEFAGYFLPRR